MSATLYLDLETFSETPITNGANKYAEQAEVLLTAFAWNDEPVTVWDMTEGLRDLRDVQSLIDKADRIVIHNSGFDRTVLRHRGVQMPVERVHDTMVQALAHSLPASLGMLCDVLGAPTDKAKDKAGKKLIQLFTKPRPKNVKLRRATRDTHPEEWAAFIEYARLDVDAMRHVSTAIPSWNTSLAERELWQLDQRINDRGVAIDLELADAALRAFQRTSGTLAAATAAATGGVVRSTTQRAVLLKHLEEEYGFTVPDLTKGTVTSLLTGDLPAPVRALLENRAQAAATSPAKYKVLLRSTSSDGRLRGTIQFCGAARTGRDCLAEGTPVLVKDDMGRIREVPIEDVSTDDRVWDGEAWVAHAGVVYSGEKDVIEHDGVLATAKHIVYISTTESMTLGEAKEKGLPLWQGDGTQFTN